MADWGSWRKHVDYVVATRGKWFGIGDGDGAPLFDLDVPLSQSTPDQWMESTDLEVTLPGVDNTGAVTRAARLLVMDAIDKFDPSGQLPPAQGDFTLLAAFPGENGLVVRRGGVITHVDASDTDNDGVPAEITIHALNAADVWHTTPAVSWPAAWWAAEPMEKTSDESGIAYSKPRDMARVELATNSTFLLKQGQAGFVIRRLAQESLDAVMMTQQDPDGTRWIDDPFHVVEVPETDNSPEISLLARDGMLWDTVADQAKNAGLILGARLWWPGDPPIRCWTPATSAMSPEQVDISPSQTSPTRTVGLRSFQHPMVVLTVKEVG